jgi:hypothetical protein
VATILTTTRQPAAPLLIVPVARRLVARPDRTPTALVVRRLVARPDRVPMALLGSAPVARLVVVDAVADHHHRS